MKTRDAKAIARVLAGIRINKIADREVKQTLINDYLYLRRIVKKFDEDWQEIVAKFQRDWAEEIPVVDRLRKEGKPLDGHEAYVRAERDASDMRQALESTEVETLIKSVPMDAFVEALGNDGLTFEELAILEDGGVLE
jgi:hypothetical protein